MDKIFSAILTYARAEAEALDYAGVLAKLQAKSIINRSYKLHVLGDLIKLLGVEQAGLVAGTLQAASASNPIVAGAWIALNTTGLQLADDERQVILESLAVAGSWPADTLKKVKELGKTERSPIEAFDLDPALSLQDVQDAWTQYLFEQEYIQGKQAVDAAIENGRTATVAALRALADNLEA